MTSRGATKRSGRRRNERGIALVEAALVMPLVMLLILGIIEGALMFRTYLSATNATNAGARSGSIEGNNTWADYLILQALAKGAPGASKSQITEVVVYKASGPGAGPDSTCTSHALAHSGIGVPGVCNVYSYADLNRPETDFGPGGFGGDLYWPSSSRVLSLTAGTDFLGVWVHMQCQCMSQTLFGIAPDLHATSVIQMEPTRR